MMDVLITFIRLILFCLPFVGICLLSIKLNMKKEHRYRQVFLPPIAVIYCTVAVLLLEKLGSYLLTGIYYLCDNIAFLSFLSQVNWSYYLTFIFNVALIIGFILIKAVLFPVFIALTHIPKLINFCTKPFYYIRDEDAENKNKDIRYLYNKYGNVKKLFFAMYISALIVFSLLLVITYYLTSIEIFSSPFYPAFGILVLGEILFFLSGITYEEKKEIEEEPRDPEEHAEIDYETLIEKYSKLYPGRFITSSTEPATPLMNESVSELLDKYRDEYNTSLKQEANLMYHYFSALENNGEVLDEGYLYQARNILDKKSVLFFTQFYDDTTHYVFLPVVRHLMRKGKILIVLGRQGSSDNVKRWFELGMTSVNSMEGIWNVCMLSDVDEDSCIAIIEAKNIYDQKLLSEKSNFLATTTMVFIIEPTLLLGTMQIGLSCLVSRLRYAGNDPQYIIYERNCDGLVDSLSHVLNKSLEQVSATTVGTAKNNMLFWKADGRMMHHALGLTSSRYLGGGTELAIVALRETVSKVIWASSSKFPLVDMRWIANQYYAALCRVSGLKVSQNELSEHLEFIHDPNSIPKTDNSLIVAEDEFNNAFETARQFTTRGIKQSLVNVISQNYWLRDYMTDNMEIFKNDAKSIPTIAADYQRSTANTVYKLIMRMISGPVEEDEVRDMLDLIGCDTSKILNSLQSLIIHYFFRKSDGKVNVNGLKLDSAITVDMRVVINPKNMYTSKKRFYSILNRNFVESFLSQLKIVYYLAEDETDRSHFLGSEMFGHVYQKYLPGMFTTLEGKYYQIISMTKSNGVLVRRAADHIGTRHYYRTLRRFSLTCHAVSKTVGAKRTYGRISFEHTEADIHVETSGYYDLSNFGDMKNAKKVLVENIEPRDYTNKEIIRIRLAGSTNDMRMTVATLLNELFVTTFPDIYQYITACTHSSDEAATEGYFPALNGENDENIYIIEDSLIDLGLLINVDRYFIRFLEIICDVIDWHKDKLANDSSDQTPDTKPPEEEDPIEEPEPEDTKEKKKRRGLFGWLFGKKKKRRLSDEDDSDNNEEDPADESEPEGIREKKKRRGLSDEDDPADESNSIEQNIHQSRTKSSVHGIVLRDDIDDDISGDDSDAVSTNAEQGEILNDTPRPYAESHYLLFGGDSIPEWLVPDELHVYLCEEGLENNYLKQSRDNNKFVKLRWYNYHFEPGVHYCDFCGCVLDGKFDILDDGRERCKECTSEAITKLGDFRKLYKITRKEMEQIFKIKLKAKIRIKMCNAKKIAEELGQTFEPSPRYDGRTLGFAVSHGRANDIYIENGAPRVETAKTLVHEMTHTWQFNNLPELFNEKYDPTVTEGMAVWAEVQYLTSIGLKERALDYITHRLSCDDEYGNGLRLYLEKYKIEDKPVAARKNPFACKKNPLR